MKTLTNLQKIKLIRELYPKEDEQTLTLVDALIKVFINGFSLYAAEKEYNLPKSTLAKRVKKIRTHIELIETVMNT